LFVYLYSKLIFEVRAILVREVKGYVNEKRLRTADLYDSKLLLLKTTISNIYLSILCY